jgi:hypothetical protein
MGGLDTHQMRRRGRRLVNALIVHSLETQDAIEELRDLLDRRLEAATRLLTDGAKEYGHLLDLAERAVLRPVTGVEPLREYLVELGRIHAHIKGVDHGNLDKPVRPEQSKGRGAGRNARGTVGAGRATGKPAGKRRG